MVVKYVLFYWPLCVVLFCCCLGMTGSLVPTMCLHEMMDIGMDMPDVSVRDVVCDFEMRIEWVDYVVKEVWMPMQISYIDNGWSSVIFRDIGPE
jgi:hypothetical protein